jgi:ABC-type multidrug transport system, ATPase and permease components
MNNNRKTFRRILSFAKPWGRYWPPYLVLCIFSVIFGIANFALIGPMLDVLFQADSIKQVAKPEFSLTIDFFKQFFAYYLGNITGGMGVVKGLLFVCAVLIASSFLSNLCRFLSQRIIVSLQTRMMKNIRTALFEKITTLPVGYFTNKRKGDILSSVSNDVNELQNTMADSFHIIFRDPLLVLGFLSMLFYMSPKLTAVSIVALPFSAIVIGSIVQKLRRKATITQTLMGRITSQFEEAISGARIIKGFNAQKYVDEKFENLNAVHCKERRSVLNRQASASPLSEFLGITVAVAVLFYGGILNINGQLGMSWSAFVVYIGFYWRVLEPAKAITEAYAKIQRGIVSGERIFAILDAPSDIKDKHDPFIIKGFNDSIEFRNVSFSYQASLSPVLRNIELKINKGQTVAVVGPSGAGKSTMADLVPRFYDVTEGSVLVDGHDVRDLDQHSLISLLGIVTQETILFNDTVYNNITFGMDDVKPEDVYEAAKVANAHDFIAEMPEGYQTNIGDMGSKLSGGQRQRIAIARAVLKNPPILILDEATSALDTESERLVQDALTNLMKNRTSLVIAHRLSTIKAADEIIVIQDGKIEERGSHDSLLEMGGLYSHLYHLQS